MDRKSKRENNGSRILPETAVQGLPSEDVDAVPTDGSAPVTNKKDTSKLKSLFDKLT